MIRGVSMQEDNLVTSLFKVGNPVRIEYNNYAGRVTAFEAFIKLFKENELRLGIKTKEIPSEFKPGTKLYLLLPDKGNRHFFSVNILELIPGTQPQLVVSKPEHADIAELRRFFRCDVHLAVKMSAKGHQVTGWIKNLSASGLLAIVKSLPVRSDNVVDCEFQIPTINAPYIIKGIVVRMEPTLENQQLLGISFLDITDKQQNEIIRYLFQRQRELLQKNPR